MDTTNCLTARSITFALVMIVLVACQTQPGADASAQGEELQACMARAQSAHPELSPNQRQKSCRSEVGHAAFEAPPASVPAPVH